jgi:hypothetical protein
MADIRSPNPPGSGSHKDGDEEVIELTRVVSSPEANPGKVSPDSGSRDVEEPDLACLAAEIIGGGDSSAASSGKTVTLPMDQLEQALEKVVKRLYSGVIEAKILEIMEKHVQREIDKITALIADAAEKGK